MSQKTWWTVEVEEREGRKVWIGEVEGERERESWEERWSADSVLWPRKLSGEYLRT